MNHTNKQYGKYIMNMHDKIRSLAYTEKVSTDAWLDILYQENVPQDDPINHMIGHLISHSQNMQDIIDRLQTDT